MPTSTFLRIVRTTGLGLAIALGATSARAHSAAPRVIKAASTPTVRFISPQDLYARLQRHEPVVIGDVRRPLAFGRRHIQGALDLPRGTMKAWGPKLSKKELVVLYCG